MGPLEEHDAERVWNSARNMQRMEMRVLGNIGLLQVVAVGRELAPVR